MKMRFRMSGIGAVRCYASRATDLLKTNIPSATIFMETHPSASVNLC